MDANALLPYLMKYGLASREDTDYITNANITDRKRNMYIIRTAPYKDSTAFERFVKCLEEVGSQKELASHLRKGMSKFMVVMRVHRWRNRGERGGGGGGGGGGGLGSWGGLEGWGVGG